MENYCLASDVANRMSKGQLYGKKGDKVKVIDENSPVVIVENEKGERFTTRLENLEVIKEEKKPDPVKVIKEKKIPEKIKYDKPLSETKKIKPAQTKLF